MWSRSRSDHESTKGKRYYPAMGADGKHYHHQAGICGICNPLPSTASSNGYTRVTAEDPAPTLCAVCAQPIRWSDLIDGWTHRGPFLHHTIAAHTPTPEEP